jgi:hypothetical protein
MMSIEKIICCMQRYQERGHEMPQGPLGVVVLGSVWRHGEKGELGARAFIVVSVRRNRQGR